MLILLPLGSGSVFCPVSFRQTVPGAIWLHAVSVGEVLSVIELARRLQTEFPRAPVFLSVGTLAGYATARQKLAGTVTGVFYAPIDHVFAVRRVLRALQPALVVIVETEIWPNLFREAKRAGCGLVVAQRPHFRPHERHVIGGCAGFFVEVMRWPDAVLAQSEAMRERYLAVGTPPHGSEIGGNLKYDVEPHEAAPESPVRQLIESRGQSRFGLPPAPCRPRRPGTSMKTTPSLLRFTTLAATHRALATAACPPQAGALR